MKQTKQKKFAYHQKKKKQFIDALRLFEVYNIKIEYQKIKN